MSGGPRWLALVESNTTGSGREFCASARAHGHRPVLLAAAPGRYPYLDTDQVDRRVVDTADAGAVAQACRHLAERGGLAGVTSSSEYFAATAAEAAGRLGLPAPDPAALRRCRRKDRQRARLARASVPVPEHRAAGRVDDAVRAAEEIGYPVVVKPVTGSGSVGVRLCADPPDVRAHAAALLAAEADERGLPVPRLVLVERYVPGPEYSVETFDAASVCVVAKHLGPAPYFVETGHDVPAPVPPDVAAALAATALAALSALGLGWGAAHTELRLAGGRPVVIEVNPRLAGGMIPTLVRLAAGVDLVDAVIARVAGRHPAPAPRPRGHAAIRFALATAPGAVVGAGGLAEARSVAGVARAELTAAPGTDLAITHSFRDRIGFAVAVGADPATAATRAERAAAHLYVDTRRTQEAR